MGGDTEVAGGDTGGGGAGRDVLHHHGARADGGPGTYLDLIDHAATWTDVDVVAYHGGASVGTHGADGGHLTEVDVVAYYRPAIDHKAETMLYVETVSDARAGGNHQAVSFLVAVGHHAGQGVEPPLVAAQAPPEGEAHADTREAAEPYAEDAVVTAVVAVGVGADKLEAVAVAARHGDAYLAPGGMVYLVIHNERI